MTKTPPMAIQPTSILWRQAQLLEIFPETPRVKSLLLLVPGWPGHQPGQHVDVRLTAEGGRQAERSYSIASAPEPGSLGSDVIQLTIERLGDGEVSPYLTEVLRPGDHIELRGPIGDNFTWTVNRGGPLLLVAAGTGIVPIMSILRHRAARHSHTPAWLLYSSRSYEEIIFRNELDRLAAAGNGLRIFHTLTRNRPPAWRGFERRIDREMLQAVLPGPELQPQAYVCGPTQMVEAVAAALVDLGHDPSRVRTERFAPTG